MFHTAKIKSIKTRSIFAENGTMQVVQGATYLWRPKGDGKILS